MQKFYKVEGGGGGGVGDKPGVFFKNSCKQRQGGTGRQC